jgi:uncharacterized protein YodC (DUF2158 family)
MSKQNPKLSVSVGDLVQLNSGGPQLTVSAVEDNLVTVGWIGEQGSHGRYGKAEFPHECLRKV